MSTKQPVVSLTPNWQAALAALAAMIAWTLYWYQETAIAMVSIWARSDTYAHAFLVPPISLWLIWQKRGDLLNEQPAPSWKLALLLVASSAFWLLGELTAANAATQFALVATLVLLVPSCLGLNVGKKILFPLAFLFFAVPIGDFMLPQLMEWTASFTVVALRMSGIPVYREGLQFVIPSGNWSVVEACSGVRYIIASVTVGTLFAYINFQSAKKRLIFTVFSLLVPVVANWLRAYMIVMLGHLSNNRLAAGVDHLIYGWLFFGLVIMVMFLIGSRWSDPPAATEATTAVQAQPSQKYHWPSLLLITLIVTSGPLFFKALDKPRDDDNKAIQTLAIPAGWSKETLFSSWQPTFANPSSELHSAFVQDGRQIGLYIAYYRNQDYARKLVTSTNTLVQSSDRIWSIPERHDQAVNIDHLPSTVRSATLLGKESTVPTYLTAWQWYWINGKVTTSDFEAKLLTALARITGHGDDSAVIVLYSPQEYAPETLPAFAKAIGPELARQLEGSASR